MSRSYKSRSGGITTAVSDKSYKVVEHRRARRYQRVLLNRYLLEIDPEADIWFYDKKFGNRWAAPKDGKQYCPGIERK